MNDLLKLQDGRKELYQWDTDRKLIVDGECSEVHFSNKILGNSVDIDVVDGVAKIPDEFLQTSKDLSVWAYVGNAESGYTKTMRAFKVNKRPKPADYVYTPSEIQSLKALAERVKVLEETGGVTDEQIEDAVKDYLDKNPIESNFVVKGKALEQVDFELQKTPFPYVGIEDMGLVLDSLQSKTASDIKRLEQTLKDILDIIQGGELTEIQISDIEQLIVSYFENKTVAEVER